jgi:hypothetical protein
LDDINIRIPIDMVLGDDKSYKILRIKDILFDINHKLIKQVNIDSCYIYSINKIENYSNTIYINFPYELFNNNIIIQISINNINYDLIDLEYSRIDENLGIDLIYEYKNITKIKFIDKIKKNLNIDYYKSINISKNYKILDDVVILVNRDDYLNNMKNYSTSYYLNDNIIRCRIIKTLNNYSEITLVKDLNNLDNIKYFELGMRNILMSDIETVIYGEKEITLLDIFDKFNTYKLLEKDTEDYNLNLPEYNINPIDKYLNLLDYKNDRNKERYKLIERENMYDGLYNIINAKLEPKFSYIPYLVDFIIDSVELLVNGETIDKVKDIYMYLYHMYFQIIVQSEIFHLVLLMYQNR